MVKFHARVNVSTERHLLPLVQSSCSPEFYLTVFSSSSSSSSSSSVTSQALLGTRPVDFTLWHAKLMQSVARDGLEVLADQGESEIYEAQDLGSSLGTLGNDVDVPLPRLDDDDLLGPVARIFQRPARTKQSAPLKEDVTADEYVT
mgnify:CR=1 FL=1